MEIIITVTMEVAVHGRPVNANRCQYVDRRLLVVQCSERLMDMSFPKAKHMWLHQTDVPSLLLL